MAITLGSIMETHFDFTQAGIAAKMIQYFQVIGTLPPEGAYDESRYCENMFDHVKVRFANIIPTAAQFVRVYAINRPAGLLDGSSTQAAVSGTGGSLLNAPFVSISVFQQRNTRLTRNGAKRFPFPSEASTAGGVPSLVTANKDFLEDFFGSVTDLVDTLGFFSVLSIQPVIIPRVPLGGGAYETDYANPNIVVNAQVRRVTSQNTRKT